VLGYIDPDIQIRRLCLVKLLLLHHLHQYLVQKMLKDLDWDHRIGI
jgi:hypothetical protein